MNVEDQLRATITRQADRFEVPPPDIDGFAAGAMRRQRRHRMVAAVAACAVLGIVASGFVAGRGWWDTRGAGPAGQPTSPTQEPTTSPSTDDRVGFVGPPPPGTPPTGPATGELVAAASLYSSGTWVYADGRIINALRNYGNSDEFRGFVVRQLTASGVEALRSFLVDGTSRLTPASERAAGGFRVIVRDGGRLMLVQDFKGCDTAGSDTAANWVRCPGFTDPDWLPASAWQDATYRPFIAATFAVCLFKQTDATVLPATVADIFLASPKGDNPMDEGCREVATADARTMADALEEAGAVSQQGNSLWFNLESLGGGGEVVFSPILPHGETFCDCG